MRPPLLDLNFSSQYWEDQGANLLANPDFEGAAGPPPASWSVFHITGTRENGTRTGGAGSYIGRGAYDGANAIGFMYQGACTATRRYHSLGWMNSDGVAVPTWGDGAGATFWTGLASSTWQQFDETHIAAVANIGMVSANLAAGRYINADDLFLYEQFLYTRAQGVLCQTPATSRVQLGDGRTAATFPTQLPNRGMSFDGTSDYCAGPSVPNGVYTIVALVSRESAAGQVLLDCRQSGGTGFFYYDLGSGNLSGSSGTTYVDGVATMATNYGQLHCVACAGITLNAPGITTLFTRYTYASYWVGKCYGFRLFPGTLTPRQLRDQRQRMLARVHQ